MLVRDLFLLLSRLVLESSGARRNESFSDRTSGELTQCEVAERLPNERKEARVKTQFLKEKNFEIFRSLRRCT